MATILSIESAVSGFSVAVHHKGNLLSFIQLQNERVASSQLTLAIQQVISFSEISLQDLSAIAISSGPGSYTGLRIGVSTAKGLCVALDIPLLSVNTLELMCYGLNLPPDPNLLLCPLIDARRMEVYTAIYENTSKKYIEQTSAKVVDEYTFQDFLSDSKVIFFGNGAKKLKPIYVANKNAIFLSEEIWPTANNMGSLAYNKYLNNNFEPLVEFEPFYLKPYFATTPKNKLSL